MDGSSNDAIVAKARQIFSFLEALDQHRNPVKRQVAEQPWHLDLSNLPDVPEIDLTYPSDASSPDDQGAMGGYILRVQRPPTVPAPPPPRRLQKWVGPTWDDPKESVFFVVPADGETTIVRAASPDVLMAHLPAAEAA